MKYKKPTLEQVVNAIVDRYNDVPYPEVLKKYELTPDQFSNAVNQNLYDLIRATNRKTRPILEEIFADDNKRIELFRMGEEFIEEQYMKIRGKILGERQRKFYKGTYSHPENVELLVYVALAYHNPELASKNRAEVAQGIKNLLPKLRDYLYSIGLEGLMQQAFEKGEKGSPLAVLKVFDKAYQKKTGDVSLFDLSQEIHLHKWGDNFQAPNSYWKNTNNVEEAIYHTLTEHHPELVSTNRAEAAQGIKNLPTNLKNYLYSIGLGGLMNRAFEKGEKGSPLAVLKVFDKAYQKKTGDVSLFDLSQKIHLHKWGDNFKAPSSYWKKTNNVEEAVYHTLTEHHPELASKNRAEVAQGIKNLPTNLNDYLYSIGLGSLMNQAFEKGEKGSPLAVLKVFDRIYQKKTGDVSLFDKTQEYYLEFNVKNMIIR